MPDDVTDPTGTGTLETPDWVSGWHVTLVKLGKAVIQANRVLTHDINRLVDDLFAQHQEK